MIKKILSIFTINCNKHYKRNMYIYLMCVFNKNIKITDYDKKIYVIYNNIDTYLKISKIFLNHDYDKYITYDTFTHTKIKKHIYLKDFFICEGYVQKNKDELLKELIQNTIKIIDIYYLLQVDDNRINLFNSNILKQYIINVVDIVNISINQN